MWNPACGHFLFPDKVSNVGLGRVGGGEGLDPDTGTHLREEGKAERLAHCAPSKSCLIPGLPGLGPARPAGTCPKVRHEQFLPIPLQALFPRWLSRREAPKMQRTQRGITHGLVYKMPGRTWGCQEVNDSLWASAMLLDAHYWGPRELMTATRALELPS